MGKKTKDYIEITGGSYWDLVTKGDFEFHWWWCGWRAMGVHRFYYDGWHLSINLPGFSLTWMH